MTGAEVAQFTHETADGSLRWNQPSNGTLRADRGHDALTLRRGEDDRVTLMTVAGGVDHEAMFAESMNPQMRGALTILWKVAQSTISSS
jgi:hypothetical protein